MTKGCQITIFPSQDVAYPATATANGSTISLTSRIAGSNSNYSLSTTSATTQTSYFSGSSFSSTAPPSLTGGRDPLPTLGASVATTYGYNVRDQLETVTQGAQTRTFTYDDIGRVIKEQNPESGTVCYGVWQNSACVNGYDAMGNLVKRTDARGVVTSYGFDPLGRPATTSYDVSSASNVPATPTVTLTYGTESALNNNGRLVSMTDGTGSESYTYNLLGQVTQLRKIVGGVTYNIGYAYNAAGAVTSITYPSGRVVQQGFDAAGRLNQIRDASTTYASNFGYLASGALSEFNYGNGVQSTFTYNSRLQLESLKYVNGANTLFSLTYDYGLATNDNGQIRKITDNVHAERTVSYSYDELGRLKTAATQGSGQWSMSWSYDRYGNRTNQELTGGTGYDVPLSFDPSTNHTNGLSFDPSGNVTLDNGTAYQYDGENRLVNYGNGGATYSFDGNGLRVKRTYAGSTTVYLFSSSQVIAEYASGSAPASPAREYIYSGGLLAKLEGANTTYYYPDQLSTRMTQTGATTTEQGHYPFGETWYGSSDKWQFTSYQRDGESGNDYAMFRSYVNRYGRFLTPDPAGAAAVNPVNPQTWNRYAYVGNDPTNFVDPLGLCPAPGVYSKKCVYVERIGTSNYGCSIDGVSTDCGLAFSMMERGAAYPSSTAAGDCYQDSRSGTVFCGGDANGEGRQRFDATSYLSSLFTISIRQIDLTNVTLGANNGTVQGPPKSGPQPLSFWDKAGLVIACIAGMDPEFAKPMGEALRPADSTDSTNTTEGQGPPTGPNKSGRSVPYGGSPEIPSGAAGGAAYGAGVGQCITNVFTAWPKR